MKSSTLTFDQFQEICDPLTFHVIGRKSCAIHPHFLMMPTDGEVNIEFKDVICMATDVDMDPEYVLFAIAVYRLGMSTVLGYVNIDVENLASNFPCFGDPKSRLEILRYYSVQMLSLRDKLRYKRNYVNILLKSATNSKMAIDVLCENVYGGRAIMLFCGLSLYTLLMACDAREVFGRGTNVEIINRCQLEWRMLRNGDLSEFFHAPPKIMQEVIPLSSTNAAASVSDFDHIMTDYNDDEAMTIWDFVTGYQTPTPPPKAFRSIILMEDAAPKVDVWGNTGDDEMENITLFLDAAVDSSPFLGVAGRQLHAAMENSTFL